MPTIAYLIPMRYANDVYSSFTFGKDVGNRRLRPCDWVTRTLSKWVLSEDAGENAMAEQVLSDKGSVTINANERELWLIRSALQAYLTTFGHDEGEIVEEIKALQERLRPAGEPARASRILSGLW